MKRILFLLALFSLAVIVGNATASPRQGSTTASAPGSSRERRATNGAAAANKRGVELFVYSGRENPTWDITPDDRSRLVGILNSLPTATEAKLKDKNPGYAGFVVAVKDDAGNKMRVRAYNGKVRFKSNGELKVLEDRDRQVENFLLETGRSSIDQATFDSVKSALSAPR